ncbi:MAG: ABC transporter permease subunit [Deltaproteobacteria bacterium]|nr:ABC transporter permease subunit [Deltaproteobacteria bacterium]
MAVLALPSAATAEPVRVGSKKFTESVILGEVAVGALRDGGFEAEHTRELGGSRILWNALRSGEIDLYPEYSGTLVQELLDGEPGDLSTAAGRQPILKRLGVRELSSLGFQNTYAVGMLEPLAKKLAVRSIGDLARHPDLRLGFSNEFMEREDGWPKVRRVYGLDALAARGLDHDLAYRGLHAGNLAATDLYSTDAEIAFYGIRVLTDDAGVFPEYSAMLLVRDDLDPRAVAALERLGGRIDRSRMVALNARAKLDRTPEAQVAAEFLGEVGVDVETGQAESRLGLLVRTTRDHLALVAISLLAAILVAVPLGIAAARRPRLGAVVLAAVGVVQTIPSLALLVMLIPVLGIGAPPAIVALFLYSLLPIVRNTHSGLVGIPTPLIESAIALGLPDSARLRRIELPLALPAILAGVKTSAVINVGTATLGALIGAGGYGQPILTGIRLDDVSLILMGAVPAAVLALLAEGGFAALERALTPKGLR